MRPTDVYALPAVAQYPWYEANDTILEDVFGFAYGFLDNEAAQQAGASPLQVVDRLSCMIDTDRWAHLRTLEFNGKLFGIHRSAGYREMSAFHLTDRQVLQEATAHLLSFRSTGYLNHTDATGDEPDVDLAVFANVAVIKVGEETRLVNHNRLAEDGTLIFDDAAYTKAFDEIVRPAFKGSDMEPGFKNPEMRAAAGRVIAAAVPGGLDFVEVADFEVRERGEPAWIGVVVATGEGSYQIGIPSWYTKASYFAWSQNMSIQRIGGPEEIDRFREAAAPAP